MQIYFIADIMSYAYNLNKYCNYPGSMSRPKVEEVGSQVFPVYNDNVAVSVLQVGIFHVHHRGARAR